MLFAVSKPRQNRRPAAVTRRSDYKFSYSLFGEKIAVQAIFFILFPYPMDREWMVDTIVNLPIFAWYLLSPLR